MQFEWIAKPGNTTFVQLIETNWNSNKRVRRREQSAFYLIEVGFVCINGSSVLQLDTNSSRSRQKFAAQSLRCYIAKKYMVLDKSDDYINCEMMLGVWIGAPVQITMQIYLAIIFRSSLNP